MQGVIIRKWSPNNQELTQIDAIYTLRCRIHEGIDICNYAPKRRVINFLKKQTRLPHDWGLLGVEKGVVISLLWQWPLVVLSFVRKSCRFQVAIAVSGSWISSYLIFGVAPAMSMEIIADGSHFFIFVPAPNSKMAAPIYCGHHRALLKE